MLPVPFGRRDRLTSAVGPDASGSNPGSECSQIPEKSGMDAPPSSPLPTGRSVGAPACPKAGVTTTAATANTRGKFRHCESIALLLLFVAYRWKFLHLTYLFFVVVWKVALVSLLAPRTCKPDE